MSGVTFTDVASGGNGGCVYGKTEAASMPLTDIKALRAYAAGDGGCFYFKQRYSSHIVDMPLTSSLNSWSTSYF